MHTTWIIVYVCAMDICESFTAFPVLQTEMFEVFVRYTLKNKSVREKEYKVWVTCSVI